MTDDNAATLAQWVDQAGSSLEDFKDEVVTWFGRGTSFISSQARLDRVSLNAIGPDGHYADPGNPHDFDFPSATAPTGPSAVTSWPQLTTCVSLRTAVSRGLGTHGRVYTPTALASAATGRVSAGNAASIATSFKDFIVALNAIDQLLVAGNVRVGVVSNVGSPGPSRIVTNVLVGDVLDTQRRRRNALVETYSAATV